MDKLSPFWNTPDFDEGEEVTVKRLGPSCPGEYKGIVRGYHAADVDGHPDMYIIEFIERPPGFKFSCSVIPRGCVDHKAYDNWFGKSNDGEQIE